MILVEPLDHQIKALNFFLKHKWVLCADEMGLGKSLQALMLISHTDLPATIVCPASLRDTWLAEIYKMTDFGWAATTDLTYSNINIVSYEGATKYPELFNKGIIVCDESHKIKNMPTQRTKAVHKAVQKYNPEYVILLSGTPITNRVPDLYSPLRLLSREDGINGMNIKEYFNTTAKFCRHFCYSRPTAFGVKYYGSKNLEQLKSYLRMKYIRRKADKVLTLPPSTRQYIKTNLKTTEVDRKVAETWERFKDKKLDAGGTKLKKQSAVLKAPYTAKFVEDILEQEDCCVVFSDHPDALTKIAEKFKKKRVDFITGVTPTTRRQEIVDNFQGGKLDILFLSIGAASVGLTLTRSRIIVFNDASWTPADNAQAEKRIDRIGQKRKPLFYYVTGSKIDDHITKANTEKLADINKIVD